MTRNRALVNVEVLDIGTRRGPAPEAQSLYIDLLTDDEPHPTG